MSIHCCPHCAQADCGWVSINWLFTDDYGRPPTQSDCDGDIIATNLTTTEPKKKRTPKPAPSKPTNAVVRKKLQTLANAVVNAADCKKTCRGATIFNGFEACSCGAIGLRARALAEFRQHVTPEAILQVLGLPS